MLLSYLFMVEPKYLAALKYLLQDHSKKNNQESNRANQSLQDNWKAVGSMRRQFKVKFCKLHPEMKSICLQQLLMRQGQIAPLDLWDNNSQSKEQWHSTIMEETQTPAETCGKIQTLKNKLQEKLKKECKWSGTLQTHEDQPMPQPKHERGLSTTPTTNHTNIFNLQRKIKKVMQRHHNL